MNCLTSRAGQDPHRVEPGPTAAAMALWLGEVEGRAGLSLFDSLGTLSASPSAKLGVRRLPYLYHFSETNAEEHNSMTIIE